MEAYVNQHIMPNGVAEIIFYHPKSNAMPGVQLAKLAQTIEEAGSNPSINLIVLKSAGEKVFCAGASFEELIQIENLEVGKAFFMGFANVINAIRKCPKLVLGRVQGKAVGGGVGLAAATDYCLATQNASVKLSELNIGIGPFVIEPAVRRKMGLYNFTRMTLQPDEFFEAKWAHKAGLYSWVYDTLEELDEGVMKLADNLEAKNPDARAALKKVLWEGTDRWDELLEDRAEMSGKLVLSDFTKKALAEFKR